MKVFEYLLLFIGLASFTYFMLAVIKKFFGEQDTTDNNLKKYKDLLSQEFESYGVECENDDQLSICKQELIHFFQESISSSQEYSPLDSEFWDIIVTGLEKSRRVWFYYYMKIRKETSCGEYDSVIDGVELTRDVELYIIAYQLMEVVKWARIRTNLAPDEAEDLMNMFLSKISNSDDEVSIVIDSMERYCKQQSDYDKGTEFLKFIDSSIFDKNYNPDESYLFAKKSGYLSIQARNLFSMFVNDHEGIDLLAKEKEQLVANEKQFLKKLQNDLLNKQGWSEE